MLRIKTEFKDKKVAFGKGAKPLGTLNQDELEELALIARQSGHKRLLDCFEELPTLKSLRKGKADRQLAEIDNNVSSNADSGLIPQTTPTEEASK